MMENLVSGNPWGATNLAEFLFYCCPECDIKFKDSQIFVDHALKTHESALMTRLEPVQVKVTKCKTVKTEDV